MFPNIAALEMRLLPTRDFTDKVDFLLHSSTQKLGTDFPLDSESITGRTVRYFVPGDTLFVRADRMPGNQPSRLTDSLEKLPLDETLTHTQNHCNKVNPSAPHARG